MKQKGQNKKFSELSRSRQILVVLFIAMIGFLIFLLILNVLKPKPTSLNIEEAQKKCMLMEEVDLLSTHGGSLNDEIIKKAENTCLSLWDSPEKEESFKKYIETDWEEMKMKTLEGKTLQSLYEASK